MTHGISLYVDAKRSYVPHETAALQSIRLWLFAVAGAIFFLVIVGGMTRLTESGLSITEWNVVSGVLPPMGEAAWAEAMAKYRQIPQAAAFFPDLTLSQFQFIFLMEWGHRLLARLVGVVFFAPFLYFLIRRQIPRPLTAPLMGVFALGGLQGFVGWWMVSSGLANRVEVAHERLAVHLLLALFTASCLIYMAVGLSPARALPHRIAAGALRTLRGQAFILVCLVFLQIGLGALVAGLHAGLMDNTWPLMEGRVVPPLSELFALTPRWRNVLDNPTLVQLCHRLAAYALFALACWHGHGAHRLVPKSFCARQALTLLGLIALQATLGIVTLVTLVPLPLALLHQFVGALVLGAAVAHLRTLSPPMAVHEQAFFHENFGAADAGSVAKGQGA